MTRPTTLQFRVSDKELSTIDERLAALQSLVAEAVPPVDVKFTRSDALRSLMADTGKDDLSNLNMPLIERQLVQALWELEAEGEATFDGDFRARFVKALHLARRHHLDTQAAALGVGPNKDLRA